MIVVATSTWGKKVDHSREYAPRIVWDWRIQAIKNTRWRAFESITKEQSTRSQYQIKHRQNGKKNVIALRLMIYLWMMFANISEQLMYKPTNKLSRSVNPGNQLWNNLQPSINLDCLDTVHKSFIHLRPMAIIEPQGQQSTSNNKQDYISSEERRKASSCFHI